MSHSDIPPDITERLSIPKRNGKVGHLAGRVLVGERITGGAEPPDQLAEGLLYEARLHSLSSEPAEGKSLLALWASLETMRRGRAVLYLDAENGPALIAERLADMGADPAALDRHFHYHPSPEITLAPDSLTALRGTVETVQPALAIFDSLPDFLALAGFNENDASDVTRWVLAVCQPLKEAGCAVLLLDHLAKSVEGRGRYARGSGAKLAKVDVAWSISQTMPVSRERVGELTLTLRKDREAYLPTRQKFAVGGVDGKLVFRRAASVIEEPDAEGLTESARIALSALKPRPEGLRFSEWMRCADMPKTTFRRAVGDLIATGNAVKRGQRYHPQPPEEGPRGLAPKPRGHEEKGNADADGENPCKTEGPQELRPHDGPTDPGN